MSADSELIKFYDALDTAYWVSEYVEETPTKNLIECGFTAKEAMELDLISSILSELKYWKLK